MEISMVRLGIDYWQEYLKGLFRAEGGFDWAFFFFSFCGGPMGPCTVTFEERRKGLL